MSDIDVFTIDDDFDPLADIEIDPEEVEVDYDYQAPIPDAEKSVVPPAPELSAPERIEKLLAGMPGQQFRALRAVELCAEPLTMAEVVGLLAEEYPNQVSVFSPEQVVSLLEQAGALERVEGAHGAGLGAGVADAAGAAGAEEPAEGGYLVVTQAPPARYKATADGLDAVDARKDVRVVEDLLAEEPRYLPLYERIMGACAAEEGALTKELDAAVDGDELCAEPRRFCGYFRGKLEAVGALAWDGSCWRTTELGRQAMASGVFDR